ncbi:dihydroxyacetone kinase subunit DhaK [Afifella pfennigii]|uniref:dihydroxyacetone kinase subunit DhaK n=1 Tax=Afifella pfennigii TaxID=209897 RepID=UPI00047D6E46|nr:dihydroxyacetone kinase subunit DhaK [Afifella pfennigii]
MKKLMNDPENYVEEMLDGLVAAHPSLCREGRVVRRASGSPQGRVGIASGGGSGHLPLFTGYVGPGLLDSCAIGNVFEGPNVQSCEEAIRAADGGRGVLCLYGNYGGDRMNFDMACDLLAEDGIATATVLGTDDIASADAAQAEKRRGVAGLIYAYKTAGAAAATGAELEAVAAIATRTVARTRTIGLALSSCQLPTAEKPTFTLGEDEIEMGMGIHGEPGLWRDRMRPADALCAEMIERLLAEAPADAGKRVSILVNGLGATPLEELFIVYRCAAQKLEAAGFSIERPLVGPFVTSMEMAGVSISLCFLDDELAGFLAAPAECPFWRVP